MIYGYVSRKYKRGSYDKQTEKILSRFPKAVIVREDAVPRAGEFKFQPKMEELFRRLKEGDTVVFAAIDRMAPDARTAKSIYITLYKWDVDVVICDAPYLQSSNVLKDYNLFARNSEMTFEDFFLKSEVIDGIFDAAYRARREAIENQNRGRVEAAFKGKTIGSKPGQRHITTKYLENCDEIERRSKSFDGDMQDKDLLKELGLARNTYYKYKKMIKDRRKLKIGRSSS